MSGTKRLSVDLPAELVELVEAKVATGEYDSESDVVADGLRALQADDPALERWLREEVAPTYDVWDKGEMQALSAEEVWANLEVHMNARAKKAG